MEPQTESLDAFLMDIGMLWSNFQVKQVGSRNT